MVFRLKTFGGWDDIIEDEGEVKARAKIGSFSGRAGRSPPLPLPLPHIVAEGMVVEGVKSSAE